MFNTLLSGDSYIFMNLLTKPLLQPHKDKVMKRTKQVIFLCHLVVYMLHPKYARTSMTHEQVKIAKQWLNGKNPEYLPVAMAFQAEVDPFQECSFLDTARTWIQ